MHLERKIGGTWKTDIGHFQKFTAICVVRGVYNENENVKNVKNSQMAARKMYTLRVWRLKLKFHV